MKKTKLIVCCLSLLALAGCSGNTPAASDTKPGQNAATLKAEYLSPAQMSYNNMRPNYNYYLTNFTFEALKVFSDDTYCFTISSSTFSAVILPETGNAATANERENYLAEFYGKCTSKVDDLDDDTLHYSLSAPERLVYAYDSTYFIDTANWTDAMKEASKEKEYEFVDGQQKETGNVKTYDTGAAYLATHTIPAMELTVSIKNSSLEFKKVTIGKAD